MKLFGFNTKKQQPKFHITDTDRAWVEETFSLLILGYGYPSSQNFQITFSEQYFQRTFQQDGFTTQNLMLDIAQKLEINAERIELVFHEDLRDTYAIPYEISGDISDTQLEVSETNYKIHLAKSIKSRPKQLVYNLTLELIKIRLIEDKAFDPSDEEQSPFVSIAGVYFGLGLLLAQNLEDQGASTDGQWRRTWSFISEIPEEIMVFSLATFSKLISDDNPTWKKEFTQKMSIQFEQAMELLSNKPTPLFNKAELEANALYNEADKLYNKKQFEASNTELQKALFLETTDWLKADIYNSIGYNHIRLANFDQSTSYFKKAIQFSPDYSNPYNNLGYAYIQLGQLEDGKRYLEKAMTLEFNDEGHSNRGLALYYVAKNENNKAQKHFELAFETATEPVDLLSLQYADFLTDQGKPEEAAEFYKYAAELGEYEIE